MGALFVPTWTPASAGVTESFSQMSRSAQPGLREPSPRGTFLPTALTDRNGVSREFAGVLPVLPDGGALESRRSADEIGEFVCLLGFGKGIGERLKL